MDSTEQKNQGNDLELVDLRDNKNTKEITPKEIEHNKFLTLSGVKSTTGVSSSLGS